MIHLAVKEVAGFFVVGEMEADGMPAPVWVTFWELILLLSGVKLLEVETFSMLQISFFCVCFEDFACFVGPARTCFD